MAFRIDVSNCVEDQNLLVVIVGSLASGFLRGGNRRFTHAALVLVGVFLSSSCLAQVGPDVKKAFEDEIARKASRAYGVPDKSIQSQVFQGSLTTPDGVAYRFTSNAGKMLYVINNDTGAKFSYILSPYREKNAADEPTVLPANADKESTIVHAFRLEGDGWSPVETQFTGINSSKEESFRDLEVGGTGLELFVTGVFASRHYTNTLCCVSCGTYQICGQSVTSSCGSCGGGGGIGVRTNDP